MMNLSPTHRPGIWQTATAFAFGAEAAGYDEATSKGKNATDLENRVVDEWRSLMKARSSGANVREGEVALCCSSPFTVEPTPNTDQKREVSLLIHGNDIRCIALSIEMDTYMDSLSNLETWGRYEYGMEVARERVGHLSLREYGNVWLRSRSTALWRRLTQKLRECMRLHAIISYGSFEEGARYKKEVEKEFCTLLGTMYFITRQDANSLVVENARLLAKVSRYIRECVEHSLIVLRDSAGEFVHRIRDVELGSIGALFLFDQDSRGLIDILEHIAHKLGEDVKPLLMSRADRNVEYHKGYKKGLREHGETLRAADQEVSKLIRSKGGRVTRHPDHNVNKERTAKWLEGNIKGYDEMDKKADAMLARLLEEVGKCPDSMTISFIPNEEAVALVSRNRELKRKIAKSINDKRWVRDESIDETWAGNGERAMPDLDREGCRGLQLIERVEALRDQIKSLLERERATDVGTGHLRADRVCTAG